MRWTATSGGRTVEVDDDLLWTRLRLYLKVLFLIHVGFLAMSMAQQAFGVTLTGEMSIRQHLIEWSAVGLLGIGWWVLSRGRPARSVLCTADAIVPLLLAGLYVRIFILQAPSGGISPAEILVARFSAGPTILILVALALALRAALVPSSVGRTVLVGAIGTATAVVGGLVVGIGGAAAAGPDQAAIAATLVPQTLWITVLAAAFVAVTAVTSSVIYGLQREVRTAKRYGQYELSRKLGEGGMGVVYEATHVLLRRPTAVKLLPVDKSGADAVTRFEREVCHTSRLEHPNCVAIYDYGRTPDGQFYYAMEYLDGLDLDSLVRSHGPVNDARTVSIVLQAAHALAEAHAKGLVHRDIKPANIMLCDRGGIPDMVKVLDFGLVKSIEAPPAADARTVASVTQAMTVVGTPHYLAPETIRANGPIGPPADVYALGVVAYYLLAGRPVFDGGSVVDICARHLTSTPPAASALAGAPIADGLDDVLLRCLAKDPADRFQNGRELSTALEGIRLAGWSWAEARQWWDDHAAAPRADGDDDGARAPVSLTARTQLDVDIQARQADQDVDADAGATAAGAR